MQETNLSKYATTVLLGVLLSLPQKSDEKEMHFNTRAKNCLFESFSIDVFNQVFTLNMAHEI